MSIETLKAYLGTITESQIANADWVIATQAQIDLLKADAARADIVPAAVYRPDGTRVSRFPVSTQAMFLGAPIVPVEIGGTIPTGTVIDLRTH